MGTTPPKETVVFSLLTFFLSSMKSLTLSRGFCWVLFFCLNNTVGKMLSLQRNVTENTQKTSLSPRPLSELAAKAPAVADAEPGS